MAHVLQSIAGFHCRTAIDALKAPELLRAIDPQHQEPSWLVRTPTTRSRSAFADTSIALRRRRNS